MELNAERLKIRPIQIEDAEEIFSYRSDFITNKYQGWIPKNRKEVKAFINKNPKEINLPESWFQFALLISDTGKLIGDVGIHFIGTDNMQAEVGCTLNKQFHGKGYASEALKTVINFLFGELNKHRIVTSIDPKNINSIKLVERLGFRKEAHFKESLFIKGKWVDDIVYAILKKEWINNK